MDSTEKRIAEYHGDWADEKAEAAFLGGETTREVLVAVAAALRKAKADGMKEAAEFIAGGSFLHDKAPSKMFADQICPKLLSRASQIEKGN